MLDPHTKRRYRRKRIVIAGALIQMATVGLILGGAAIVLFGSMFHQRHADPMGMFGLPSVYAIASPLKSGKTRATRPIEIVSRCAEREVA
jgi:hypothetical protein